jgi:predicted small secreted protein
MNFRTRTIAAPLFAALLALGALSACNTVRGAAQDVQAGGNAIEGAANQTQTEMQRTEAERAAKEERDRLAAERAAATPR